MAADEVQRQVKVITCTRKKQAYMTVLEVLCKVKRVQDLQNDLRRAIRTLRSMYIKVAMLQSRAMHVMVMT